jgi:hypothetical protein
MKFLFVSFSCLMFALVMTSANADETISEKVSSTGKSASRSMKKGAHRIQEAACIKSDAGCAAEKVKNRAVEAKDSVVDGAEDLGNKVD